MIYIKNNCKNPHFNLALEQYVFDSPEELFSACFWLWQNDNTIVIGKNQNVYNEIDLDFVTRNKINLARRMTGGGAVYHDLGNINYTFIAPVNDETGRYDFGRFTQPIVKALGYFGIKAEYSGRNDLLIDGKKFSGNAQFVGKNKVLHHGTLLFSSDLDVIGKCLTPSKHKLAAHGVSSVHSRVTTINAQPACTVGIEMFTEQLKAFIINEFNINYTHILSESEAASVQNLTENKYALPDWIYGKPHLPNLTLQKRFDGVGTVTIEMYVKSGIIERCRISGDFFGTGNVTDIETLLQNQQYNQLQITSLLKQTDIGYYFHNMSNEQFRDLLLSN